MSDANETELEIALLRGPALVAWLVANTEKLVLVAAALDEKAEDLAPSIPRERVLELCHAVRHASLEVTVALLALLSHSDDREASALLADAIANAHVRIQKLRDVATPEFSPSGVNPKKSNYATQLSRSVDRHG